MYGLYGFAQAIQSVYRLAAPFHDGTKVKTLDDFRPAYFTFIDTHYPNYPINRARDLFVRDPVQTAGLLSAFAKSSLNDLQQEDMTAGPYDKATFDELTNRAQRDLDDLYRRNGEFAALFRLLMHSIVISPAKRFANGMSAHGGTSNYLVGMMWLTIQPGLSTQDLQEMYIHEFTHTLVFLDELNYGHFNYAHMGKREYWATSSILTRSRPMDKVVHSIAVSTEILNARCTFLPNVDPLRVHRDSATLAANTLEAIDSVLTHERLSDVCLPRAVEIVQTAREHILNLQGKGFSHA